MSPEQLIDRLEQLGVIDGAILAKLRRQLENPDKEVKPAAILKYLLKKEQITQSQAKRLLKEVEEAPKQVKHEEIEVKVQQDGYDTDDLTAEVNPVAAPAPAPEIQSDPGKTRLDPSPVTEPAVEIAPVQNLDPLGDPLAAGDPLAGGGLMDQSFNDPYASGAQATTSGENVPPTFAGKRYKPDQWQTKWLYIGFGILGTLLIFGAVLYVAVGRQTAEDMFKAAMSSFEAGTYTDAIQKFDEFLERFPDDDKAPTVKARRVQALIASTYESKNWDETIKRAENHLPGLLADETVDMNLIRDDLGVMLPQTTLAITERALKQKELPSLEKELAFSERAKQVVDNPAYVTSVIKKRNPGIFLQIEDNIRLVQGMITKENDYEAALGEIKNLASTNQTDNAFAVFQKLTRRYGDLAARLELQQLMKTVSGKEKELVKPVDASLSAVNAEMASAVSNTVVLASRNGSPVPQLQGDITPIFAQGSVYGIDAGDGSVAWRRFVGYQSTIEPQAVGEDDLLICDQRSHEILRVKRTTNELVWRLSVAEPFVQPAVSELAMVVTTRSGKIMKVDPENGSVLAACQLPQPANVSAMIAERQPLIYQPGLYSNLYVLSSDDMTCRDVYYLGHQRGSIQVPPVAWSGHLLVGVNAGNGCDLHVLKSKEENGLDLQPIQLFSRLTTAPVTEPIGRFGRRMLLVSENGELQVLSMDTTNDQNPVTKFVTEKIENRGGDRLYHLTQGNQLWIAGKGINRLRLKVAGSLDRELIFNAADKFVGPMQIFDETLVHVRRRNGSAMLSVAGVDSKTLKEKWRTDLGGPVAGQPAVIGNELVAMSNQGDMFRFADDAEVADNRVKSSTVVENLRFDEVVNLGNGSFAAVGPLDRREILFADFNGFQSKLVQLVPPADRPACAPVALDGDLIVPSKGGPVVRINAQNGQMVGAPYQPPVRPGIDYRWLRPVVVDQGRFAIANAPTEGSPSTFYVLDGRDRGSIQAVALVESAFPIKSQLAAIANIAYAVVQGENGDSLVAVDCAGNLEQKGTAELDGAYVAGPWTVGSAVLVQLDTDKLVCFDGQLNQKWSYDLGQVRMAGVPQLQNNSIMLTFQDGKVELLNLADGNSAFTVELQQPVSGPPTAAGQKLYVGGMDGTVHVVNVGQN